MTEKMTMNDTVTKQTLFKLLMPFSILGYLLFLGCCLVGVGMGSLWGMALGWINPILVFYIPQLGTFTLLTASIVAMLIAFKKHKLNNWKPHKPLRLLIIYCLTVFGISHSIVFGYAIPTKIDNQEIEFGPSNGGSSPGWLAYRCCLCAKRKSCNPC